MASSIALVVIVAAGQAHDATTTALAEAARTAAGTKVVVEEGAPITDEDALAIATRDHADVVAIISWDADHSSATVHVHREGETRWLDRAVGFRDADAATERGRTLGFAIASMLPEPAPTPPTNNVEPPPKPPLAVAPPVHDSTHHDAAPVWHGAVDLSGLATVAIGGYGGGWGVRVGGQWFFFPHLALRTSLAISSRALIPEAKSSLQTVSGALGLGITFVEPAPRRPISFGTRVSMIAMHQSVSHLSVDDANSSTQSRWLPAAEILLEGALYFINNVAIVLSSGLEIAAGETVIKVSNRPVATLAPWRFTGELGFRARF